MIPLLVITKHVQAYCVQIKPEGRNEYISAITDLLKLNLVEAKEGKKKQ